MKLSDAYEALLWHKKTTGTTAFMFYEIKKARDLAEHQTCPHCGKGTVTYHDIENKGGRNYYCNLCGWKAWLPASLISLPEATEDLLAWTLVKFYP